MSKIKIYHNAVIYTVDEKKPYAQAMAVDGKRIIAVGSDEQVMADVMDRDAEKIDMAGKFILPGFIEAHAHPAVAGLEMVYQVNLNECQDAEEYAERIKAFMKEHPELDFIVGAGWINPHFDSKGPRKSVLDVISADIPMMMISSDHHSIWANSKAMAMAGITDDTPSPEGGVIERDDKTDEILGTFREEAQNPLKSIFPQYTIEQCETAWLAYQHKMAGYGITMAHDAMTELNSMSHKALNTLEAKDELLFKMTCSFNTKVNRPESMDDFVKEGRVLNGRKFRANHIKFFMDGVIEGHTAYMKEPFADMPDYVGEKIWDDTKLLESLKILDDDGWEFHFHVIGDAAMVQLLDILDALKDAKGDKVRRPIIAHAQIIDRNDLDRIGQSEALICANPYWFIKDHRYYDGLEVPILGEKRASKEYPMKSFFDRNMVVASASDFSVTPEPNPLVGIQLGVMRCLPEEKEDPSKILGPEERVTIEDMIKSFTINGAYLVSQENETGSITPNKYADFIVLDRNILEMPIEKIHQVKVLKTFSEGKEIYSR